MRRQTFSTPYTLEFDELVNILEGNPGSFRRPARESLTIPKQVFGANGHALSYVCWLSRWTWERQTELRIAAPNASPLHKGSFFGLCRPGPAVEIKIHDLAPCGHKVFHELLL